MDRLTKEQRTKNMRAVKNKGSKIEVTLAKAMWDAGLRYRKNDLTVFGKPDFTFKGLKIAVFCDSEFWHGKDWERHKEDHKSNVDFWIPKIERNMARDKEVTDKLQNEGWTVVRFWGKDILKKTDECLNKVRETVYAKKFEKHIDCSRQ